MPLDVAEQLESIDLDTWLSGQGGHFFIWQDDPSIFRLLQFVLLDVGPDEFHSFWSGGSWSSDDGLKDRVHIVPFVQVVVAKVSALRNPTLSLVWPHWEF